MIVKLSDGYYIDSWYDKYTKNWVIQLKDPEGNQIDSSYVGNRITRDYEINEIKELFESGGYAQDMNEDINSVINKKAAETLKKTKGTKLNYFGSMEGKKSHIMPDAAAGIPRFNSNMGVSSDGSSTAGASTTGSAGGGMGESLIEESVAVNVEQIEKDITAKVIEVMQSFGFDDTDAAYYSDVEVTNSGDYIKVEVRAEVSYSGMEKLSEALDPIVQKYDRDAYFDFEDVGIMVAYIDNPSSDFREAFKRIDNELFDEYSESLELEMFYEAIKKDLTTEEENKIKEFVSKPGITAEEAKTFIAGMEKNQPGQVVK